MSFPDDLFTDPLHAASFGSLHPTLDLATLWPTGALAAVTNPIFGLGDDYDEEA